MHTGAEVVCGARVVASTLKSGLQVCKVTCHHGACAGVGATTALRASGHVHRGGLRPRHPASLFVFCVGSMQPRCLGSTGLCGAPDTLGEANLRTFLHGSLQVTELP
uniref:Uncharacterized protein n=1 Tax=Alexandrium monilatum TaxID=311494 RepID=A0A6T0V7T6_9DINO|mmetsp:Transcript_27675/g.82603  ORF Transcript_27675/g.82603 Transcript_27675/m.82603 type:complete len:107 (-) Transcript_27675:282-602(-)